MQYTVSVCFVIGLAAALRTPSTGLVNTWEEVAALPRIYLNIGGGPFDKQGKGAHYNNYVAVEAPAEGFTNCQGPNPKCTDANWCVCHVDPSSKIPLPDASVDRIHSEDCLEHIMKEHYPSLLAEFYRLLKPGGRARLSMPDYNNPKDAFVLQGGYEQDPRNTLHVTMTNYALLKEYVDSSPFHHGEWLQYWDNSPDANSKDQATPSIFIPKGARVNSNPAKLHFIDNPIDYTQGWIKRTPEHDSRTTPADPLVITSLVFDLVKSNGNATSL